MHKKNTSKDCDNRDNNNNNGNVNVNNNNGNFICVFECTIVNVATSRQFINAACDWMIKKKKRNNQNCIKSGLFQFLFIQQKNVICCSNGYIYHFLD